YCQIIDIQYFPTRRSSDLCDLMLVIRDYDKTEYPLLATKIVNSELNGQEDIELTIHQQKNNNLDLKSVDKMWELYYNNITYKIRSEEHTSELQSRFDIVCR